MGDRTQEYDNTLRLQRVALAEAMLRVSDSLCVGEPFAWVCIEDWHQRRVVSYDDRNQLAQDIENHHYRLISEDTAFVILWLINPSVWTGIRDDVGAIRDAELNRDIELVLRHAESLCVRVERVHTPVAVIPHGADVDTVTWYEGRGFQVEQDTWDIHAPLDGEEEG